MLLIKQGYCHDGLQLLRTSLDQAPEANFQPRFTAFLGELAQGFACIGQVAEGLKTINEALLLCERNEDGWCLAELLRIKAELLSRHEQDATALAECLTQSLERARCQQAFAWELRTAISTDRLGYDRQRPQDGRELLRSVYGRFTEGFEKQRRHC